MVPIKFKHENKCRMWKNTFLDDFKRICTKFKTKIVVTEEQNNLTSERNFLEV